METGESYFVKSLIKWVNISSYLLSSSLILVNLGMILKVILLDVSYDIKRVLSWNHFGSEAEVVSNWIWKGMIMRSGVTIENWKKKTMQSAMS